MLTEEKWTEHQRCIECGRRLDDCDWCDTCEIELRCAQSPEGLAAATLAYENSEKVLYLARAPASNPPTRPGVRVAPGHPPGWDPGDRRVDTA
jgi:hypothetical protein